MTHKLRWNPSIHAVRRIKERLGIEEENAKNFVNQLTENAKYVTTQADGRLVYKHAGRNVMIVVNTEENVVVTLYSAEWTEDGAPVQAEVTGVKLTLDNFVQAIKREYKRFMTQTQREIRKLSEQQAKLNVDLAKLTLNYVRCNAPHTKALLQSRIDELKAKVEAIAADINVKSTQIEAAKNEVKAVIAE